MGNCTIESSLRLALHKCRLKSWHSLLIGAVSLFRLAVAFARS